MNVIFSKVGRSLFAVQTLIYINDLVVEVKYKSLRELGVRSKQIKELLNLYFVAILDVADFSFL